MRTNEIYWKLPTSHWRSFIALSKAVTTPVLSLCVCCILHCLFLLRLHIDQGQHITS